MDHWMTASFPPRWSLMWGMAILIYATCKWVSWIYRRSETAPLWQHAAYLFLWPGMDPDSFLNGNRKRVPTPALKEGIFAFFKFGLGMVLLTAAVVASSQGNPILIGWIGMIGIVMTLHFGLFHLLSCLWRSVGLDAKPIMNWPIASRSLSEFWGRRWNLAFRDLTHRFLFRPFLRTCGPSGAFLVGFLISGVVHDLVISGPAGGGWGGPICYFLIQGVGIMAEHSRRGRDWGLNRGATGRLYAIGSVLLPVPLLFHQPFVLSVIVPFLQALRSI